MKKMSSRERFLLVVLALLIVGVLYYTLFYVPIQDRTANAEQELEIIQDQLELTKARVDRMEQMQAMVDKAFDEAGGNPTRIPYYDNVQVLIKDLNNILSASDTYSIGFDGVMMPQNGHIVRRTVTLSYTCGSYQASRQILDLLGGSQYRCMIGDLSISNDEGSSTVSATLTFFEYKE